MGFLSIPVMRPLPHCFASRALLTRRALVTSQQDTASPHGAWPAGYEMGIVADWCGYLSTFDDDSTDEFASESDDEVAVTPVSSPTGRGKSALTPPKHFQLAPKDLRKLGFAKMPGAVRGGQQRSMGARKMSSGGSPKASRSPDVSYTR